MPRLIAAALTFLALAGCQGRLAAIDVAGETRRFAVHVPANLPDTPVPLLLALHQFTDTAQGMRRLTGFDAIADEEGFIVAYPQGIRRGWNSGPGGTPGDVAFLEALAAQLQARYAIDPDRIYATGLSAGGMMSQWLACESELLAAIAPVAGTLPTPSADACARTRPVPALFIHGTEDSIVPFGGGNAGPADGFRLAEENARLWAAANGCGTAFEVEQLEEAAPDDGTTATRITYSGCPEAGAVHFYRIDGGGHTWPGRKNYYPRFIVGPTSQELDASRVIWDFLSAQRRAAG